MLIIDQYAQRGTGIIYDINVIHPQYTEEELRAMEAALQSSNNPEDVERNRAACLENVDKLDLLTINDQVYARSTFPGLIDEIFDEIVTFYSQYRRCYDTYDIGNRMKIISQREIEKRR